MVSKIHISINAKFIQLFLIFVLLFSLTEIHAQCAGQDANAQVCDIPNASSQSIDLFSFLGGTPTAGGTWSDDDLSGGLNPATGILNAQMIGQSGIYNYTYTVTGVPGCVDSTAVVTVTIGAYAGVTTIAQDCSDNTSFNLFQVFDATAISPQSNGTWNDDDSTGALSGNILNSEMAGVGTFNFTYTVPAIGTCPARSATATVRIFRAADSGVPFNLILCNTDDLTVYNNLSLNALLIGEDAGGRWVENSGTMEITSPSDSTVNVETINTTFGPGTYTFTYTVLPSSSICSRKTSTVTILIEQQLDFTGATLVVNSDICENEITTATYTATVTQGSQNIPDGQYDLTYTVSGPNGTTNTIEVAFSGGVATFPLSATFFQQVGSFSVEVTAIDFVGSQGACTTIIDNLVDVLNVNPIPKINTATLTINPICQNSGAVVQFSGTSNLSDGNYLITYNLSGNNTISGQTIVITVVGGTSSFSIPASQIPNAGNTVFTITNIQNLTTNCSNSATLSRSFVVNPLPDVTNLGATINNVCFNEPVTVLLTGLGTLTNVMVNYNLTGANLATNQSVTLTVTSGNASFVIPQTSVPNTGVTTFSITFITNTVTGCGIAVNNFNRNFTINPLPANPTANDASFCKTENATIADLSPSGNQYQWFDTATSNTALPTTTLLTTKSYYVREVTAAGCASGRTMVNVTINNSAAPTLNANGEEFCGLDNPTLQNLSANTTSSGTVVWYDAASNGNLLPNTTLLQEGVTYYGFDSNATTGCNSENNLAVTVTLNNCNVIPGNLLYPDGFSPNGDGTNDTFSIPNIEFTFPNYSFEIYNRYGNLMFTGNKNKPTWDGRASDSANIIDGIAPNGVYFYIINYNKDNTPPKQGRLYLNR